MARLRWAPAGVMAQVLMAMTKHYPKMPVLISQRLSSLPPLTQLRIGGLINFMHERKIVDRAWIEGDYPDNRIAGGGNNYLSVSRDVAVALQAMHIDMAATSAMEAVVGIQESIFMLGIGKVLGKAWEEVDNGNLAQTAYGMLCAWAGKQYGDPVDIVVGAM